MARTFWPDDFALGGRAAAARTLPAGAIARRKPARADARGAARRRAKSVRARRRCGSATPARRAIGPAGRCSRSWSTARRATTTRRTAAISRSSPDASQADGRIGDWLVNNFYSLDVESEKGIVAAPVPLDNYLGDLNSGQGWYRPSLHAGRGAARRARAGARAVGAEPRLQPVLPAPARLLPSERELHEHQRRHAARARLAGPARGPVEPLARVARISVHRAEGALDRQGEARVRLPRAPTRRGSCPRPRLEEAFASLLDARRTTRERRSAAARSRACSPNDLDALAFVRIPQFPSSRAFGDAPAVTTREYQARVPNDPALVQIVPVPPRPFPDALRDAGPARRPRRTSVRRRRARVWARVVDRRHRSRRASALAHAALIATCSRRQQPVAPRERREPPDPESRRRSASPRRPTTTAPIGPSLRPSVPARNSPSSLLAPMNMPLTALTRPRMSSGVSSCTSVCRIDDAHHVGAAAHRERDAARA